MTHPEISWIVPMYRTSDHLDELLARISSTAARMAVPYEVLLVDDACPDGAGVHAERAARGLSGVHVVRLSSNHGQDGALRAGLRVCRGKWAVLLDADLQDPPEAVIELWARRDATVDAVFANRRGAYTTTTRLWTSGVYRRLVSVVAGLPMGACLFVLLNRRLIDRIASTRRVRISILAAVAAASGSCDVVRIERSPRPSGRSAYNARRRLGKALSSLWQMFLARWLGAPL